MSELFAYLSCRATGARLYLLVDDVPAIHRAALDAGATEVLARARLLLVAGLRSEVMSSHV